MTTDFIRSVAFTNSCYTLHGISGGPILEADLIYIFSKIGARIETFWA